ncbi:hypothetical protein GCM10023212_25660 [Luteolibacter yonseiensis]
MVAIAMIFLLSGLRAAEATPEDLLRLGLFEEEANRNFDKAAESYRAVVAAHDRQRALAATATFRLGEIARKKNDRDAAAAAFRTVAQRFPEQTDLVRMSRENLAALGMALPNAPDAGTSAGPPPKDPEDVEIEQLKGLGRSSPDLIDGATENGWRHLHLAAVTGRMRVLSYLIEQKVDVDSRTIREQFTSLQLAAIHGRLEVVNALLAANAKIDETVKFGPNINELLPPKDEKLGNLRGEWAALDLAILYDRREVARALIKAGADVRRVGPQLAWIKDEPLNSLLLAICFRRNTTAHDIISAISGYGDPGEALFSRDLLFAVRYNGDLVEPLINMGRRFGYSNPSGGIQPLIAAVSRDSLPTTRLLVGSGADPKAVDENKRTVLFAARSPEMVDYLLSLGVELNAKDKDGLTAVGSVISGRSQDNPLVFETYLKHGALMEEPEAMMSRASGEMLTTVLDKVIYPKSWRADRLLLSLDSPLYGTVGSDGSMEQSYKRQMRVLETKSGAAGDLQPLMTYAATDEIKKMMVGNSWVLSIIRRDAQGGFNEIRIGKWNPDSKEWRNLTKDAKGDQLKWGDIIEIRSERYGDTRRKN